MNQRLTRNERVRKSIDVQAIRLNGRKYLVPSFVVYRFPNANGPRIAIAITRKSGGSVVRNRVRRKIRELFRTNKGLFGHFDYFFYTSRDLTRLQKEDWDKMSKSILKVAQGP